MKISENGKRKFLGDLKNGSVFFYRNECYIKISLPGGEHLKEFIAGKDDLYCVSIETGSFMPISKYESVIYFPDAELKL